MSEVYGICKKRSHNLLIDVLNDYYHCNSKINVWTLPGPDALKNGNFESRIKKMYKKAQFHGVECDHKTYEKIKDHKFIDIKLLTDIEYWVQHAQRVDPFDFVWLDWFGPYSKKTEESIKFMTQFASFKEGAIVAMTLNTQGKYLNRRGLAKDIHSGKGTEYDVTRRINAIGRDHNKCFRHEASMVYRNLDKSSHASPMTLLIYRIYNKKAQVKQIDNRYREAS